MPKPSAQDLIHYYQLQKHPEGGYFKETYRSQGIIKTGAETTAFPENRHFSTAIYYLLESGDFSAFHRIKSDELWHFYSGGPLFIHVIDPQGNLSTHTLGTVPAENQAFQIVVPAGCWFAAEPAAVKSYSFVGCTVAPGFDFSDFE